MVNEQIKQLEEVFEKVANILKGKQNKGENDNIVT